MLNNESAKVLAVYHDKFYRGKPAVTSNRYGGGEAVYFGAAGCQELLRDYLPVLLKEHGVSMIPVPEEVYVTIRENAEKRYLFLINMNREDCWVEVPCEGKDCISGERMGPGILLPALGVVVLDCDI